ncbi:MAG: hypothetical protein IPI49_31465 [Myxococcales bacterium]|nr:hypothetical protein [Myxococcales bacterium]
MQSTSLRFWFLAAASASLVACDEAPAPTEVRQGISQNLAAVLPEVVAALESDASGRVPLDSATGLFDLLDGEADVVAALARVPMAQQLAASSSLDAERAAGWLTRNVFSDANHRGDGVYRVTPQVLCALSHDPTTGDPGPDLDEDCAVAVNKIEPKIKASGDAQELTLALLLGPSENEPVSVTLSKKAIALRMDLGETAAAVGELTDLFGGQRPNLRAAGRVALSLAVLGPQHVTVKGTIERAVDLAFAELGVDLSSAAATRFASAAAQVWSVEIDGVAQTLTAAAALGATSVHSPADALDPAIDLDLPGVTGTLTVAPGQPVKFTGLGLGKRSLTVNANGTRAATIDVNPDHGRSFDVTVTENAGAVSFAVSPALDLRMQVDRAALGEPAQPYEVTRLLLDGTAPTLTLKAGMIQVTSGHFAVTTSPAQYGVDASAGQCLAETAIDATTTRLTVATCPL